MMDSGLEKKLPELEVHLHHFFLLIGSSTSIVYVFFQYSVDKVLLLDNSPNTHLSIVVTHIFLVICELCAGTQAFLLVAFSLV